MNSHPKILPFHLNRDPYVYVRQSSLNQVLNNGESTERQYALADRACQLGWGLEQVITIDEDQGQSAASSTHRAGFQQLISAISLDQVELCWCWKYPGWRAAAAIGTGSWNWQPCRIP